MTMVRLVSLIGEIKYPNDVDRIKRVFHDHFGLNVSEMEAQAVWLDHSDGYCAGWLFMPEDDLELVRILSMYVEEVE